MDHRQIPLCSPSVHHETHRVPFSYELSVPIDDVSVGASMVEVHGFCDERFGALEKSFRANLDSGMDKGASLAVTMQGEFVVDLWGGTRDYGLVEPWESDTVVRVFSCSKAVVITCVLILVDRGLLDLDAPIAQYWPEFAAHGKGAMTCRQVLTHRSGIPGFRRSMTLDDLGNAPLMVAILENAELWYEPGTITCYGTYTFGCILGEVVHRLSGIQFDEFVRREITEPLGADFAFSTPSTSTRVAAIWPAEGQLPPESPLAAAVVAEVVPGPGWIDPNCLPLVIPSASGITNARALARVAAVFAMGGELDGRRYLGRAIIEESSRVQNRAVDELLGPINYGLGFGLDHADYPAPTSTTFHWGGYGGSFIAMDPASGISAAFAQNQLLPADGYGSDPRFSTFFRLLGEISNTITGVSAR